MIRQNKAQPSRSELSVPISFPEELPISNSVADIQKALDAHQVLIVVGETGSGKTTQLPKICLQHGRGRNGVIIHTQPRRLAARGIARRLQEELGQEDAVGLKVRFDDKTSEKNYVQVMTDGLLLNLFARDPLLRMCDTLIIDEAHERSLNIDFLLGLAKRLLLKRPEFRLIITSATIKHHLFSEFFKNAPVFSVSGRTFPVAVQYLGPNYWGGHHLDPKISAVVEAVAHIYRLHEQFKLPLDDGSQNNNFPKVTLQYQASDTLVFLPGEREIHETAKALRQVFGEKFDIVPLYARLAASAQSKVFSPEGRKRIVLATNLAETSITVPRIGFVIDSGLVRVSRYSQRRKVQLLPIEPISQASAAQRAGRCGRIAPGVCIRLFDQEDFLTRPEYPEAEIHRTHLAGVILQMKAMRLGEPAQFPFIEPPATKLINDGYQLLEELGAVSERKITALGMQMSRLPVDPRIARMITAAGDALYEILIIASALSVMDVIEAPREARDAVRQRHAPYHSRQSDFISKVILWHRLEWHRQHLTRKEFQVFCEKNFIHIARFYEWRDVHKQLLLLTGQQLTSESKNESRRVVQPKTQWAQYLVAQLADKNLKDPYSNWLEHFTSGSNEQVHAAIVSAYATQIAIADQETQGFLSCRQRLCFVHPSTHVKTNKSQQRRVEKKPASFSKTKQSQQWIVIAEFLETQKLWARQVAVIDVEWVLPVVSHLLKYTYSEPGWSKKKGAVFAKRSTSLYGLFLKKNEQSLYSHVDPKACREIFIQTAFVEQQLGESRYDPSLTAFLDHNKKLIEDIEMLEARTRTSGLMANDEEIYDFYDNLIPDEIVDRRSFLTWWKKSKRSSPHLLDFTEEWLFKGKSENDAFPKTISFDQVRLSLEYHFDPGHQKDGVTVIVPEEHLYSLNPIILEWLVPGLIAEKCEYLIRGLPKVERKKFVPVPQFVQNFLAAGYAVSEPLTLCLEDFLKKMTGQSVLQREWPEPVGHLKMKIRVVTSNDAEKIIIEGENFEKIKSFCRDRVPGSSIKLPVLAQTESSQKPPTPRPIKTMSDLPDMLQSSGSIPVTYTTLKLSNDGELYLHQTPDRYQAESMLYSGLQLILLLQTNALVKNLKKQLFQSSAVNAMVSGFQSREDKPIDGSPRDYFWQGLMKAAFEKVFMQQKLPENAAQAKSFFEQRSQLYSFVEKTVKVMPDLAASYTEIANKIKFIEHKKEIHLTAVDRDTLSHFNTLFSFGWLHEPSLYNLETWPVLVQGLSHRLEKQAQRGERDNPDAEHMLMLKQKFDAACENLNLKPLSLKLEAARLNWGLQALRVAVFAQHLAGHLKSSPKIAKKNMIADIEKFEIDIRKN